MIRRPRLRSVLLVTNFLILLLPLGGIAILRLYESELVRRTEAELLVQASLIGAAYRYELLRHLGEPQSRFGEDHPQVKSYGVPASKKFMGGHYDADALDPINPVLDIAEAVVLPPAPDAIPTTAETDPLALKAADHVQPLLAAARRNTLAGIRVMDFKGTVVAATREGLGLSLAHMDEVSRALKGEVVRTLRERVPDFPSPPLESISRGSRVRVFVAAPVREQDRILGVILLSRTPLDISKALYMNRSYLILGGAAILTIVVVVSILTSLMITRPVAALMGQASRIAQGGSETAEPIKHPGTYEVERLSGALADMSVTLRNRAEYIRAFASNVSHAFKTPLTSLCGTVELLRDHLDEMSPEDRDRFVRILEDDADRLTRLVQRLLELARAESYTPGRETASVREMLERTAARSRVSGLPTTVRIHPAVSTAAMAPEVLESILAGLLDNARQHGGPGVQVHMAAEPAGRGGPESVDLLITDTGVGIPDPDRERVFKPLFTTARGRGGTGLGLSIVQALVSAHGGSITLEPAAAGTMFRITLPA